MVWGQISDFSDWHELAEGDVPKEWFSGHLCMGGLVGIPRELFMGKFLSGIFRCKARVFGWLIMLICHSTVFTTSPNPRKHRGPLPHSLRQYNCGV